MPDYEFELADGTRVTEFFPMADAPECGTLVKLPGAGLTARRVPSTSTGALPMDWSHVAYSLRRNHPDFPRVDAKGRGVFLSKQEQLEFRAKNPHYDIDR